MGYDLHEKVAAIVRDAGGKLVGRTRLQKVGYLMQLAGFAGDFQYEYRHYGPYSEELAEAMEIAVGLGIVREEKKESMSGAWYSIYHVDQPSGDDDRARFIATAAKISAIELELAATAAFLHTEEGCIGKGAKGAWAIASQRKQNKAADGRLEKAKEAYRKLRAINVPEKLPLIA